MANDKIVIKGAREHNLKNVNLTLPREKFIVMTGLSGSGKSSLAFDTIYADGQRRYVESLSSYARMFLGRMDKPDVDEITGLSPAISIDQKTTSHNPRSTVGTVTEIYDYLRLLYARVGVPHCPVCGRVISQQSVDEIVDAVLKLEEGTKFQVLAPVVRQRKGTQQKELDAARRAGYARVKIDGNMYDLDEEIALEKNIKHTVEIVVDRLAMRKGIRGRLADSLETALALTDGVAEVDVIGGECMTFSQNFACPEHGISISDLSPRLFSFNNPLGACEKCTGLGTFMRVDEERILPNRDLSIREGAVKASGWYYAEGSVAEMYYLGLGKKYGFTLDTPIKEMSTEAVNALLYGTNEEKIEMHRTNEFGSGVYYNTFEGIVENLERRFRETNSEWMKEEIGSFMSGVECPDCHGKRLKPVVLAVTIGGKNISDFCEMSIRDELKFIADNEPNLTEKQKQRFLSGTTIHEVHRLLGTAFQYAVEWGILVKSPVPVDSPKKSTQERTIWTVEEMRTALDSMEDPILHLAVHLTLVGALREGEIVGLTPEDIDFDAADGIGTFRINKSMQRVRKEALKQVDDGCIIKVFPDKLERSTTSLILKSTKTASSCRTIFMTSALKEELKKWLNQLAADERKDPTRYHDSGMLFRLPNGLAVEPVLIRKKFLKWQDAHPEFPRIVFHGLRHSSATYQLMISGGDVKAVQGTTGHATADMLVNTYAHIQQSSRVELGKKFESGFYAKPDTPSPQAVPAAGEPTISMTALLELLKDADPEMKAKLRLALLT